MGPAKAAFKKLEVNILSWNWTVLVMKPQEGIVFPLAPLRNGPDGLRFEEQRIMLNVAPNQKSVMCQFVCEKDQNYICREMHGGGCGVCRHCRRASKGLAAL
jgi:hypothetical protein